LPEAYPLEAAIQFSRYTGKVSSIGSQREWLFFNPPCENFSLWKLLPKNRPLLTNWEIFWDLYEAVLNFFEETVHLFSKGVGIGCPLN